MVGQTRQVGEEAWLLSHVIPKRDLVEAEGPAILQ